MDVISEARRMAITTPADGEAYAIATAVCRSRGLNPDYPTMDGSGLSIWQAVIAEALLLKLLQNSAVLR